MNGASEATLYRRFSSCLAQGFSGQMIVGGNDLKN
jgi:hypothetical protein